MVNQGPPRRKAVWTLHPSKQEAFNKMVEEEVRKGKWSLEKLPQCYTGYLRKGKVLMVQNTNSEGGGASLATLALMTGVSRPVYSGKRSDWPNFQARWEGYLEAMKSSGVLSSGGLLEYLRNSLDEDTIAELDSQRKLKLGLTYEEF